MAPELALGGHRALVTGSASGIGKATAAKLASLGADVVLSDLPGPALDRVGKEIAGCEIVPADLSDRFEVERLARQAGPVDILCNNAGLQHVGPIETFPPERWDRILAVMLTAPFLLIQRLLPSMYDAGWGRVLNISSVHGLVASPYKSAYVTAKHGLIGLTKTVALEAAERASGVTAHAICPSYVRTPLVETQIADQARVHGIPEAEVLEEVFLTSNAVKRLIEPEEVAEVAAWLCGPLGWTMTGGIIPMDAGWLAH